MAEIINKISLQDGTLVRHKVIGYQGTIEGKTEIKTCFTRGGSVLAIPPAKETFQYRVVVNGETMRHIAPAEDLEILDAYWTRRPGAVNVEGGFARPAWPARRPRLPSSLRA